MTVKKWIDHVTRAEPWDEDAYRQWETAEGESSVLIAAFALAVCSAVLFAMLIAFSIS